jgi:hypothetical protein
VRGFGRRPRAGFKHYRVNMSKTSVDVVVNVPSITSEIFTPPPSYYPHDLPIAVITESSWQELVAQLVGPIKNGSVQYRKRRVNPKRGNLLTTLSWPTDNAGLSLHESVNGRTGQ